MRVIDSHILLPNMQRAGRSETEQQTRASSPSETRVSPFSRSIEANGAGCQGVWTPRATQQAAPLRSPKAFHLGFLMQLGSTGQGYGMKPSRLASSGCALCQIALNLAFAASYSATSRSPISATGGVSMMEPTPRTEEHTSDLQSLMRHT